MYMPGHQCSPKRLHMIKGGNDEMEELLDVKEENRIGKTIGNCTVNEYWLSLNALSDNYVYGTIMIKKSCQGNSYHN